MPRTGPSALKSGLIVGTAGDLFAVILDVLIVIARKTPDAGIGCGGCVTFFAILGLCVEAGNVAAATSGRVSDGTMAGLIAGGMAGAGLGLLSPILEVVNGRFAHTQLVAVAVEIAVIIALAACTMAGLGAALGALGGLIGQSRYAKGKRPRPRESTSSSQG